MSSNLSSQVTYLMSSLFVVRSLSPSSRPLLHFCPPLPPSLSLSLSYVYYTLLNTHHLPLTLISINHSFTPSFSICLYIPLFLTFILSSFYLSLSLSLLHELLSPSGALFLTPPPPPPPPPPFSLSPFGSASLSTLARQVYFTSLLSKL